jgi:hypothetical protein
MKGTHNNGKIESFGTRSVQWQENRDLDIQTRIDQLGELNWSVRNLQIQGNFDQLLHSIKNAQRIPAPMAHTRRDMEQQPSESKMTKETKSQDATLHQAFRNINLLIEVSSAEYLEYWYYSTSSSSITPSKSTAS